MLSDSTPLSHRAAELATAIHANLPADGALPAAAAPSAEDAAEALTFTLARSYFDLREYGRAAHTLRQCTGHKAIFLRHYSEYLVGEKRKEEETLEEVSAGVHLLGQG